MKQFLLLFILAISSIIVSPAQSQWFIQKTEDPFGDDDVIGAFTGKNGKALILRCVGGKKLELMFLPNEQGDDSVATTANSLGLKILVRIDQEAIDTLDAVTHSTDGKIVSVADVTPKFANRMAGAKKRIAAVSEMSGQKIGTVSFGVKGSQRQIGMVLKACSSLRKPS